MVGIKTRLQVLLLHAFPPFSRIYPLKKLSILSLSGSNPSFPLFSIDFPHTTKSQPVNSLLHQKNRKNESLAHHGVFLLKTCFKALHRAFPLLLESLLDLCLSIDIGQDHIIYFFHLSRLLHLVVHLLHKIDPASRGGRGGRSVAAGALQELALAVDSSFSVAYHLG